MKHLKKKRKKRKTNKDYEDGWRKIKLKSFNQFILKLHNKNQRIRDCPGDDKMQILKPAASFSILRLCA